MTGGLLQSVFAVLVFGTVALVAFAIGALTSVSELRAAIGRRSFVFVVLSNIVLVPAIAFLLLQALPLDSGFETGLLLCAICAGGPLGLKVSQICDGDLSWALSLTVVLLLMNAVILPAWSALLLDRSLTIGPGDLIPILMMAIVAPVLIGGWLSRRAPRAAVLWSGHATGISNVTLVLAVLTGIAANARDLLPALSVLGLLAVLGIGLVSSLVGWSFRESRDRRRVSSLVTLNRATSVALLVVGGGYLGNADVFTSVVLFGVIQTVAAVALSLHWRLAENGYVWAALAKRSGGD